MSVNVHITRINDTFSNVASYLDAGQTALLTDQDNEHIHRYGSNFYFPALSKHWDGSNWTYHSPSFNNVTAYGTVYGAEYLKHYGDDDTGIRLQTDQVSLFAGNVTFIDAQETTQNIFKINPDGSDVDTSIYWADSTPAVFVEGSSGNVGIGTTTPACALCVNGGVHIGGDSDAGDNNLIVDGTINAANIGAGTDNSVVVLDSSGYLRTDEIDSRVWGTTLVDGTGSVDKIAYWTAGSTLGSISTMDYDSVLQRFYIDNDIHFYEDNWFKFGPNDNEGCKFIYNSYYKKMKIEAYSNCDELSIGNVTHKVRLFAGEYIQLDGNDAEAYAFNSADTGKYRFLLVDTDGKLCISSADIDKPNAEYALAGSISGTQNYLAKFGATGATVGDSSVFDDGSIVKLTEPLRFEYNASKYISLSIDSDSVLNISGLSPYFTTINFTTPTSNGGNVIQFTGNYSTAYGNDGQIKFYNGSTYVAYIGDLLDSAYDASSLIFGTRPTGGPSSVYERMRITSNGNVGIGTTAPSALLDLQHAGGVGVYDMLELTNTTQATAANGHTGILFNLADSSDNVCDAARISVLALDTWTSTASTQDAQMNLDVALNGTITTMISITGSSITIPDGKILYFGTDSDTEMFYDNGAGYFIIDSNVDEMYLQSGSVNIQISNTQININSALADCDTIFYGADYKVCQISGDTNNFSVYNKDGDAMMIFDTDVEYPASSGEYPGRIDIYTDVHVREDTFVKIGPMSEQGGFIEYETAHPYWGDCLKIWTQHTDDNLVLEAVSGGDVWIVTGDSIYLNGDCNIGYDKSTGNPQSVGFFGETPISQWSATGETTGFTAGSGTAVKDDSTFTGNDGSTAYRINDIVKALKGYGLLTA